MNKLKLMAAAAMFGISMSAAHAGTCTTSAGVMTCQGVKVVDPHDVRMSNPRYWHVDQEATTKDGVSVSVKFGYSYVGTEHMYGGSRVTKELSDSIGEVVGSWTNDQIKADGQELIQQIIANAEDSLYIDRRHYITFLKASKITIARVDKSPVTK